MAEEPIYHRMASPTQERHDADLQQQSGEIWGREPYGSGFLVVQAYRGPLPDDKQGIEFSTPVAPQKGSGTLYEARWYYGETPGVKLRQKGGDDYAAIPAKILKVRYV
jgi:hypothetical protein